MTLQRAHTSSVSSGFLRMYVAARSVRSSLSASSPAAS
uniref:Uncharacterized protein n=1 Tax=Arundo donax TaxID=35708 RepID=A0A0A9AEJ2_ARUDO